VNKKFGWPYNAAGIAAIGLPLGIAGYAVSGAAGALVAIAVCTIGSLVVLFNSKSKAGGAV